MAYAAGTGPRPGAAVVRKGDRAPQSRWRRDDGIIAGWTALVRLCGLRCERRRDDGIVAGWTALVRLCGLRCEMALPRPSLEPKMDERGCQSIRARLELGG